MMRWPSCVVVERSALCSRAPGSACPGVPGDQRAHHEGGALTVEGRHWRRVVACAGALWGCLATSARAQEHVITLPPADAALQTGFTYLSSVRELRDGRVIISDPREQRLIVADLTTGLVKPVGRRGRGPQEWSTAIGLHPLQGDSSLQIDGGSRRWLVFDADRIVGVLPPDAPVISATHGYALQADGLGHVFGVAPWRPRPGLRKHDARDSLAVVRYHRTTGAADTVALLRDWPATVQTIGAPNGELMERLVSRPAFAVAEEFVAFVDGWLAVARLGPYRVDWRAPDGRWVRGRALPVPVVRLEEREKKAYLDRSAQAIAALERGDPAMRAALMPMYTDFPATVPPFQSDALIPGGDGRVYIRRTLTAAHPEPRYDIVSRRGELEGQIRLATGERIVTVSARYVYVVWRDKDDVERLRRHRLTPPPTPPAASASSPLWPSGAR
jgi:hypothetical protein